METGTFINLKVKTSGRAGLLDDNNNEMFAPGLVMGDWGDDTIMVYVFHPEGPHIIRNVATKINQGGQKVDNPDVRLVYVPGDYDAMTKFIGSQQRQITDLHTELTDLKHLVDKLNQEISNPVRTVQASELTNLERVIGRVDAGTYHRGEEIKVEPIDEPQVSADPDLIPDKPAEPTPEIEESDPSVLPTVKRRK